MAEMIRKELLPAVSACMEQTARTASLKKSVVPDISVSSETALLKKLTALEDAMTEKLDKLNEDTKDAESMTDPLEKAKTYQKTVLADMESLRESADAAEVLLPDSMLPYPAYGELLFSI